MCFAAVFCACDNDFLDRNNPASITSDDVWSDAKLITQYVNSIYNDRPGWDNVDSHYSTTVDEAKNQYVGSVPNQIWIGQLDEVNNSLGFWAYTQVRKTNEFFSRIDDAPIDDETKRTLKGEVRFLRAFLYFDMVKRYGGMPLITEPQALDDDLEVPRNTLDECFTFIVNELNNSIQELPPTAVKGKVDQGAAKALLGRVLLYYASPLFNPDNDQARWGKAAEANKTLIGAGYELYPDLTKLWQDNGNKESIFEVQYAMPVKYHGWDAAVKPLVLADNDAGEVCPVQELVDAFPMKNGKAISDPASGYDPANPYSGRDDRFYAYISYNGTKVKGKSSGAIIEITLNIYVGGSQYDSIPEFQVYNTYTGYFTRKAVNEDNLIYTWGYGSVQPFMDLRYAEILLNYAEAQNEYLSTPDQSVYDALDQIRARAGITEKLTPGSLNKDQMRSLIYNERHIEFCFEQKRFWDLRRWKLSKSVIDGKKRTGVVITKHDDGSFTYDYQPIDPQAGVFDDRMYWMPIPLSELSKNSKLEQNPGWNK
jgi:hypothetical protein